MKPIRKGIVLVSAGFDPLAPGTSGNFRYVDEALALRAIDTRKLITGATFGIVPDKPKEFGELCTALTAAGFADQRGIVMGVPISDPSRIAESTAALRAALLAAAAQNIFDVMTICDPWMSKATANFDDVVVPTVAQVIADAWKAGPEAMGIDGEYLIPLEQANCNRLDRMNAIADRVNQLCHQQVMWSCVDTAHLFGGIDSNEWSNEVDAFGEACKPDKDGKVKVRYAHASAPHTRGPIREAAMTGKLPLRMFLQALRKGGGVEAIDLECFNPLEPVLKLLRDGDREFRNQSADWFPNRHRMLVDAANLIDEILADLAQKAAAQKQQVPAAALA